MGSDQATGEQFDVLYIDDICSFLTPRLVADVKRRGLGVVGVFEPTDGSHAKRRLLECGISDVIESDASAVEFIEKALATLAHRPVEAAPELSTHRALTIGVLGSAQGVGSTELAVQLATQLAESSSAVLVDADTSSPSIAQRLDLPLHPNVRTVLDAALHGDVAAPSAASSLSVVAGVAASAEVPSLSRQDLSVILDSFQANSGYVVADLGAYLSMIPGSLREFASLILVGVSDPVGIARLVRAAGSVQDTVEPDRILLAVNRSSGRPYFDAEVREELRKAFPQLPVVALREDRQIRDLAWDGEVSRRGAFAKDVRRVAGVIEESLREV